MTEELPGQPCPKAGTWLPSNNPKFYPANYTELVMRRTFKVGEILPPTPHGEPSWIFQEVADAPLQDFTGITQEQIVEHLARRDSIP
jgi:hypothetical protein